MREPSAAPTDAITPPISITEPNDNATDSNALKASLQEAAARSTVAHQQEHSIADGKPGNSLHHTPDSDADMAADMPEKDAADATADMTEKSGMHDEVKQWMLLSGIALFSLALALIPVFGFLYMGIVLALTTAILSGVVNHYERGAWYRLKPSRHTAKQTKDTHVQQRSSAPQAAAVKTEKTADDKAMTADMGDTSPA